MRSNLFAVFVFLSFFYRSNSQVQFEDQALSLGVPVVPGNTYLGNGVSFCDFDGDGWDDLTFPTSVGQPIRFFKNQNGTFVEQDFGLSSLDHDMKSVTWVDFDNDGDKDLFVTSETVGNKLLENQGNMTFTDITASSGLSTANLYTYGASWGDINNDGYLDVFLSNRTFLVANKLYRNNGDGTFSDVSLFSGIDPNAVLSFCSAFIDINNDGYQDIYVANDKLSFKNKMYRNNGDGSFTDISMSSNTDVSIDAMSVTVDDYNNDGYFDIYVTNSQNQNGNHFFRNNGDETFTNVATATGTTFDSLGWGAVFFDAENDNDLDLYVSSDFDGNYNGFLSSAFYQNNGNGTFTLNNSAVPNDFRYSYSNAIGDINNDGLLDIVVSNINNENIFLWKNISTSDDNWVKIKLTGVVSNRDAIGSTIEIGFNGQKRYRYVHCGEGYMGQNTGTEHFGVGHATQLDYVKVTWLSGSTDIFNNVPVNQVLDITEGDNTLGVNAYDLVEPLIFPNPVKDLLQIRVDDPIIEVNVFNALGQNLIKVNELKSKEIDLSSLSSGHYFLQIKTASSSFVKRLVKN